MPDGMMHVGRYVCHICDGYVPSNSADIAGYESIGNVGGVFYYLDQLSSDYICKQNLITKNKT